MSAPWTAENRAGIQRVVDVLQQHLTAEDWRSVARVLTLKTDNSLVLTMTRLFFAPNLSRAEAGGGLTVQETSAFVTEAVAVERAFVIIADPDIAHLSTTGRPASDIRHRAVRQELVA